MLRTRSWLWLPLVLVLVGSTAGCPASKVRKGPMGKGGLPTNNVDSMQADGKAGTFLTVPPELIYPDAVEVENRPGYYRTNAPHSTVVKWATENIPGAVEIKENKTWVTLKGLEWTVKIYDESGNGVIQYTNNRYLPKA